MGDKMMYESPWVVMGDYQYQLIRTRGGNVFCFRRPMNGNEPDYGAPEETCPRSDMPPRVQEMYSILAEGGIPSMPLVRQSGKSVEVAGEGGMAMNR